MDLRYPIGQFKYEGELSDEQRSRAIREIAEVPVKLRAAVQGLNEEQLNTPYRPEGWTVRQVVHHLPDSHLQAYTRFKLGLTEEEPTVKPYDEVRWANLADTRDTPVDVSLGLLDFLHRRWVILLGSLRPQDFARRFLHPELGAMTLNKNLALYAWHGRHHIAHITSLRERMGWR
ncbi:MAG TPA: bacillithiol transferase BstA [Candidatus Acidoferrales bacterium]|nr:bacillithiol transferase BstA [Candidatus Acidoferrales bacterium]